MGARAGVEAPAITAPTSIPLLDAEQEGVCQDEATMPGQTQRPWRFTVISHGNPENSTFWSVVRRGVDIAAADMRVQVVYPESAWPMDGRR